MFMYLPYLKVSDITLHFALSEKQEREEIPPFLVLGFLLPSSCFYSLKTIGTNRSIY